MQTNPQTAAQPKAPAPRLSHLIAHFRDSVAKSQRQSEPFTYWRLFDVMPMETVKAMRALPLTPQDTGGVSGAREIHNATRNYFDQPNVRKYPVCADVAGVFQAPEIAAALAETYGTNLKGTYLRMEYAADTDGFWLEPHTDLGVKKFTFLYFLSDEPAHDDLGTDLYRAKDSHYGRQPFIPNTGLIFVPSNNTWHGFEKRPIHGIRLSLIINYVSHEWRERQQLSFPDQPIDY
jgi:hypothetical protein